MSSEVADQREVIYATVERVTLPSIPQAGSTPKRYVIFDAGNNRHPVKQYNRPQWHLLNDLRVGTPAILTVIERKPNGAPVFDIEYGVSNEQFSTDTTH